MRRTRRSLCLALAAFLGAAAPRAQEEVLPPASFGASVDVEVVEVEVFVSDAKGAPLTGLTAADFVLEVDGERREITSFFEARPRAELSAATLTTEPDAAPEVAPEATPSPAAAAAPERQLSLVVLLDELHLQPAGRKRTLDRISSLLAERLAAGDKLMIATLDRSLRVRRGFDATGPLAADLAAVLKRSPGGAHADIERRLAMSQIRDAWASRGCEALDEMRGVADSWSSEVERDARLSLSGLQELLRSLAGRSGRKTLLYVAEGMPLNPGLEAALLIDELCPGRPPGAATGLVNELHKVTRAANAAQVTVYTLDSGGQRLLSSATDAGPGLGLANVAAVRADSQDPSFMLATDTGGKALLESNRPELLVAALAQDLVAYYSLAFTPRPGDAGRAHRIAVDVQRPGARVRHRSAWDPLTAEDKLEGRVLAALRYGGEDANPLAARLVVGESRREADGSFTVPLRLLVPASGLALVPHGDRRQGRLRVLLAVQDGEGHTTPVRALPLPVDLPAAAAAGTADLAQVPLEVRLKLRRGRNTIALAVHDEVGQDTSVVRREVMVGGPAR